MPHKCPVARKAYLQRYHETNRDHLNAKSKRHYQDNRDEARQKKKQWYAENRDLSLERQKVWRDNNRETKNAKNRLWHSQNGDKARAAVLLRKYKMTPEQHDAMLQAQNFCCAICRTDKPGGRSDTWNVDHCHATGEVRGLLCMRCNVGLGNFKDSPERLQAAIEYLCPTKQISTPPTSETAGPMKASPPIAPNAKPQPSLRLGSSSQNFVGQSRKSA